MWQFFHEHRPLLICQDDADLALISGYNIVTGQHTYIGGYQTCAVLISKNCAQLHVLQMKIPRKYLHMWASIFQFKHVIGTIEAAEFGSSRLLVALQ
jgi:hypothetical protein